MVRCRLCLFGRIEGSDSLPPTAPALRWCRVTVNMMIAGVHLDDWVWTASVPPGNSLIFPLQLMGALCWIFTFLTPVESSGPSVVGKESH